MILAPAIGLVLGALVGSFLATVLLRWPAGRSALAGRSHCDACDRALGPADLVPVLSFAWHRGRCRTCRAPIDRTHLAIEIMAAAIGGIAFAAAPPFAALGWAAFGWGLLLLAALDWRHFWLPDALTFGLAASGLILGGLIGTAPLVDRVIGAAAGYGALWLVARAYRLVRHREGMGGGDPKLLAAIGAWLGWQALPFVLLTASSLGLLLVLTTAARGRTLSATTALPLGTVLCLAAIPGWLGARALG